MIEYKAMLKLAFIDNSINHDFYNPVEHWSPYLASYGVKFEVFRAIMGDFPDLKGGFTHLILSGSEFTILEKPNWVRKEINLVREAISKKIAILGSCFGHQLIALAISGNKVVRRSKKPEIGWIGINIKNYGIFKELEKKVFAFSFHFDEVFNLQADYKILASNKDCSIQAFQYSELPIWGIQFHPEININQAKDLLKKGVLYLDEYSYLLRKILNSAPKDSKITSTIVKNFLFFS